MGVPQVQLIVGTRPEAIKMAPLTIALRERGVVDPVVVATGQHAAMVAQALAAFGEAAHVALPLERRTGDLAELVGELLGPLDRLLGDRPDAVIVQGDTTSALVGGLVAFWRGVPVVHLEAGLRSGDRAAPFPEETNRRMLATFADLHLAPTERAARALRAEGVPDERVVLVGNTVVDAVRHMAARGAPVGRSGTAAVDDRMGRDQPLMLVTVHRRESWGDPLDRVLAAVSQILTEHPDVLCVLPAHPNPAVRAQIDRALGREPRAVVTDPLAYPDFCHLLARATLVLSDSGGVQEEAPTFGVPVLVLREVTERLEAVECGWAQLTGTDTARIVAAAKEVLAGGWSMPTCGNPFGDGQASGRSAEAIAWLLGRGERPPSFEPPSLGGVS